MWLNVGLNLCVLAFFKYFNFFVSSFCSAFGSIGLTLHPTTLQIILPVGISFYTFQALSYSIDVYRHKLAPTHDPVAFFAFVSFFPQLVAGPIERATHLLPQFERAREFDYAQAADGCRQMLWGLFKKVAIADCCALYVDEVWGSYATQSGSTLAVAAVLFSLQIYGDFSGYSDMAIGCAKLFGIELMQNFKTPYFSRDIAEFWRRWHISLTTWFRDYIYIPLGGSRPVIPEKVRHKEAYKRAIVMRNTLIIFLVSGLWHGANWTFVLWGLYHALLFMPLILLGKNRKYTDVVASNRALPTWREAGQMLLTFALVVLGWILFRAPSIADAWGYVREMCSASLLTMPWLKNRAFYFSLLVNVGLLAGVEWCQRGREHGLSKVPQKRAVRVLVYEGLALLVLAFCFLHVEQDQTFIYFQF